MVTIKTNQQTRFIIVGIANTGLDFLVYGVLVSLGLKAVLANYISTTCALIFSFIFNRSYTFRKKGPTAKKEIILFVIVTLIGVWVLQPLVIKLIEAKMTGLHSQFLVAMFAKVCATAVSLTWNYILYSRVVFKDRSEQTE